MDYQRDPQDPGKTFQQLSGKLGPQFKWNLGNQSAYMHAFMYFYYI
jgi:hypothetical protein